MVKGKSQIKVNGILYIKGYVTAKHPDGKPTTVKIWLTEEEITKYKLRIKELGS